MDISQDFFDEKNAEALGRADEAIDILRMSPLLDPVWYRQTYPDLRDAPIDVARHYLEHGAREGRNPHPLFDTRFYLEQNPDVAASGINPLVHYMLRGAAAGQRPHPHFDTNSGLLQNLNLQEGGANPLAHPSPGGAPVDRDRHPESLQPLDVDLDPAAQQSQNVNATEEPHSNASDISESFDAGFYLGSYSDVAISTIDPLEHYFFTGWKEGRDPADWFSTNYYLIANPDVAAAGINPFWHYVTTGREEGRSPKQISRVRGALLKYLTPPEETHSGAVVSDDDRIPEPDLLRYIQNTIQNTDGFILSLSHDCYMLHTGGTELFIADEQKLFNARRFSYVHLSPVLSSVFIKTSSPEDSLIQITINGKVIGVALVSEVAHVLEDIHGTAPTNRILIVHSPMGHSIAGFLRLILALEPKTAYYWLHDFSSLCTGYNLLRNNVAFCHAPPQDSMACSVCVYESSRRRNAEHLLKMFRAANFTVVAPSTVARKIWLESSDLPHDTVVVQEHCRVDYSAGLTRNHCLVPQIGLPGNPVRVAFVGYPVLHKGWPVFERLVDETQRDSAYQFFHFAKQGVGVRSRGIRAVDAVVTSDRRGAMVELLRTHEIDIVVIPAPWPETFSYVAFESLASGCDLITLEDSGNVAASVLGTGRGRVFENEDRLVEFFTRHDAVDLVRARAIRPNACGSLVHCGTSAAIVFGTAH